MALTDTGRDHRLLAGYVKERRSRLGMTGTRLGADGCYPLPHRLSVCSSKCSGDAMRRMALSLISRRP